MSDTFTLQATARAEPNSTLPLGSGCPTITIPFDEQVTLVVKNYDEVDLSVDTPVSVSFGGVVNASVVVISTVNGAKVTARITSADGTTQSIPIDDTFILISRSVPVTAIDLTRLPATATKVKVFLGEKTT